MPLLLSINRKGTKIKLRKEKEQCTTNKPLGSKFLKRLGTCYYSFTYIIYSTYKYICQNCTCVFVNTICLRQPKDSARCANLQPRQVYPNVLLFSNRRIFQKKRTTAFNCVPPEQQHSVSYLQSASDSFEGNLWTRDRKDHTQHVAQGP